MKALRVVSYWVIGALGGLVAQGGRSVAAPSQVPGAESAEIETCARCHEDQAKLLRNNVHFKASEQRRWAGVGAGCYSCHGDAQRHAEDPAQREGLVTFAPDQAGRSNAACLNCHRSDAKVEGFQRSIHGRSQVSCVNCHASPHTPRPVLPQRLALQGNVEASGRAARHLKSDGNEVCFSCHAETRGQFRMPHRHPSGGGGLSCASCHDPHREERAMASRPNAKCLSCHEDKRGPWAWEHAPVTEDCMSCHNAHGSVAPGLVKSAQPFLCLSCHSLSEDRHGAEVGGARFARAFYSRCTACHGAIHGSHEDRHLKR